MIIKVIHANYAHDMVKTLVASVDVGNKWSDHLEACEFAYDRTQNIFDSWSMPEEIGCDNTHRDGGAMVTVEAPLHKGTAYHKNISGKKYYGLRSSMMGDRFQVIDPDNYDSDLFYVCAMVGFDGCDPVDYQVMTRQGRVIVKNPSTHFYRNGAGQGLDYVE